MKPGKELDALVAELVMGWKFHKAGDIVKLPTSKLVFVLVNGINDDEGEVIADSSKQNVPRYSTDIAAAWQVVEKMQEKEYEYRIVSMPGEVLVHFHNTTKSYINFGLTTPHAICMAALSTVVVGER